MAFPLARALRSACCCTPTAASKGTMTVSVVMESKSALDRLIFQHCGFARVERSRPSTSVIKAN